MAKHPNDLVSFLDAEERTRHDQCPKCGLYLNGVARTFIRARSEGNFTERLRWTCGCGWYFDSETADLPALIGRAPASEE